MLDCGHCIIKFRFLSIIWLHTNSCRILSRCIIRIANDSCLGSSLSSTLNWRSRLSIILCVAYVQILEIIDRTSRLILQTRYINVNELSIIFFLYFSSMMLCISRFFSLKCIIIILLTIASAVSQMQIASILRPGLRDAAIISRMIAYTTLLTVEEHSISEFSC